MVDLRQSDPYGQYISALGWQTEKVGACQVFIRRLPLIGSLMKIQRPDKIPFKAIDSVAKKHRALVVKIEPKTGDRELFAQHGFRPDAWPLLPTKTVYLDLNKHLRQLRAEMSKKTRYSLRQAEQTGIKISKTDEINYFYVNFKKFGKGYLPRLIEFQALVKAFGKNAILLMAENLAATLILIHNKVAYYYFAFTAPAGRKKFAQYLLVWQAIKSAKKLGCQIFDFEGIEDPRYKVTRPWHGFSHFKKSFGGKIITFPGSFIKIYHPLLKLLPGIA